VSTTVLSLAAVLGLAAVSLIALLAGLGPPAGPDPARCDQGEPAICGTVSVAPELRERVAGAAALFVIARGVSGPPLAVVRIPAPHFPAAYRLGPEHAMGAEPFAGEVRLVARLSRTGEAGPPQPGDLESERAGSVPVGTAGADIVLARVH